MQLQFTPEREAFRLEVRAFVKAHLPADIRRKVASWACAWSTSTT
jgi:hypothetical protein